MAIAYAELEARIIRTLQATKGGSYSDELIFDGIVGAMDAAIPWIAQRKMTEFTGNGIDTSFVLPDDVYRLDAIQDAKSGLFAEQLTFSTNGKNSASPVFHWLESPSGSLFIPDVLKVGQVIRVFYSAYYARPIKTILTSVDGMNTIAVSTAVLEKNTDGDLVVPEDDQVLIDVPRNAETGLVYWAAAHCYVPASIGSADTRNYNMKMDSGTPIDNVQEQSAKFLRALFLEEMNRIPKRTGGM